MVSFGENNLSWIFANEEQIALEILEFLNGRDYFHLMTLNKLFHQKISSVKDQLKYDIIARQTLEQDDKIGKSESDSENEKPAYTHEYYKTKYGIDFPIGKIEKPQPNEKKRNNTTFVSSQRENCVFTL